MNKKTIEAGLTVQAQYELYLEKSKLKESEMNPIQKRETKNAFYAAFGQSLICYRDGVSVLDENMAVAKFVEMLTEVNYYFQERVSEFTKPKFFHLKGTKLAKVQGITHLHLKAFAESNTPEPHWSFEYRGVKFTHENDWTYCFNNSDGENTHFTTDDMLIIFEDGKADVLKLKDFFDKYELIT